MFQLNKMGEARKNANSETNWANVNKQFEDLLQHLNAEFGAQKMSEARKSLIGGYEQKFVEFYEQLKENDQNALMENNALKEWLKELFQFAEDGSGGHLNEQFWRLFNGIF